MLLLVTSLYLVSFSSVYFEVSRRLTYLLLRTGVHNEILL